MPAFRFCAARVLLTYSQVGDLTKEDILFTLEERLPSFTYCFGEERHEDSGRHIHGVLIFSNKFDSKDVTIFDVNDGRQLHHPNIQPIKRGAAHLERAMTYVKKEDLDPLTNIEQKLTWGEIIENSASGEEYLALIRKWYPRDYAKDLQRFEYSASKIFGGCVNTITDFQLNYEVDYPERLSSFIPQQGRSIVIVGPPGCGKTTWAKVHAPKPALFVRHLDSLSKFRNGVHKSIIFDDLDFKHLPPATQKFLVDMENISEIHIRYKVARLPANIVRIFTANEYPFLEGDVHAQAIERRTYCLII